VEVVTNGDARAGLVPRSARHSQERCDAHHCRQQPSPHATRLPPAPTRRTTAFLVPLPPFKSSPITQSSGTLLSLSFFSIHSSLFLIVSTIDSFWKRICVSIDYVGSLHFEAKQLVTVSLSLPMYRGRCGAASTCRRLANAGTSSPRADVYVLPLPMSPSTNITIAHSLRFVTRLANGKRSTLYCRASAGGSHA